MKIPSQQTNNNERPQISRNNRITIFRRSNNNNGLNREEQAQIEKSIKNIILQHFPQNKEQLFENDEFKLLTTDIIIPYKSNVNLLIDRAWRSANLYRVDYPIKQLISNRYGSKFNQTKYYSLPTSVELIKTLIWKQCGANSISFVMDCVKVLDKIKSKKNTMTIVGDIRSGNKLFVSSIANLVWSVGQVGTNPNFPFQNLVDKRLAMIEEANCSVSKMHQYRAMFAGEMFGIKIKYKPRTYLTLGRIPIFMTCNTLPLNQMDPDYQEAFRQRMHIYQWNRQPWLAELKKEIYPMVWVRLLKMNEQDKFFNNRKNTDEIVQLCKAEHFNHFAMLI